MRAEAWCCIRLAGADADAVLELARAWGVTRADAASMLCVAGLRHAQAMLAELGAGPVELRKVLVTPSKTSHMRDGAAESANADLFGSSGG